MEKEPVSDEPWETIEPLLPPEPPKRGHSTIPGESYAKGHGGARSDAREQTSSKSLRRIGGMTGLSRNLGDPRKCEPVSAPRDRPKGRQAVAMSVKGVAIGCRSGYSNAHELPFTKSAGEPAVATHIRDLGGSYGGPFPSLWPVRSRPLAIRASPGCRGRVSPVGKRRPSANRAV